ncbi:MAG: DNA/RNA nuclease SfsA [Vagococcus sp.]|uniref:DNA/RNA nuclease SfsA n=1 Tax=Vagococcus sp. TaxID=1933889 RepID=UPI002FCBF989
MAKYEAIEIVTFKERPNRFIAICIKDSGEEIVTHVKNTGRCKELLIPGVKVAVNFQDKPTRKTKYDLVAVKKGKSWFNIDSQLPNELVEEGLKQNLIKFAILSGKVIQIKREYTYQDSRFDFFIETDKSERLLVEVKGMTLESQGRGSFPDAPSLRGLKHVETLIEAKNEGYLRAVIFVVQFEDIIYATINEEMQPELQVALKKGMADSLEVLAYNCFVKPDEVSINKKVPFKLLDKKG